MEIWILFPDMDAETLALCAAIAQRSFNLPISMRRRRRSPGVTGDIAADFLAIVELV